jgi:hypothetical protein
MTADEILAAMIKDLKPQLEEMMKDAARECCSYCELEVPFQVVGLYRNGAICAVPGGARQEEGKWKLTTGPVISDQPPGVLRDYTGWARIRLSYVDPERHDKNSHVKGDETINKEPVTIRCHDRRLLLCPACLATTQLLDAKYYERDESSAKARRIDPSEEKKNEDTCKHGVLIISECLECASSPLAFKTCESSHREHLICRYCGA